MLRIMNGNVQVGELRTLGAANRHREVQHVLVHRLLHRKQTQEAGVTFKQQTNKRSAMQNTQL